MKLSNRPVASDEQLQKYTQGRLAHITSLVVVTTLLVPFFIFIAIETLSALEENN